VQAIKKFSSFKIFSLPLTIMSVERKNFKQNLDQCPSNFPPKIVILFGIIKDGKNKIQTKTTPL
jgi:hypothetical protein